MASCIPSGVRWIRGRAAAFEPAASAVVLASGERLAYRVLVVCPGIQANWRAIAGLAETLGRNGVTSIYAPGLAPDAWRLAQSLRQGVALFTQPPLPFKCPAAPQKVAYLYSDTWRRWGRLPQIEVRLLIAGPTLFSVPPFVPVLMGYVRRYGIALATESTLEAVDGPARTAWFLQRDADGALRTVAQRFDFLHVVPPQSAPDFVRSSPLANTEGWVDVDPATLRHRRYENIFALGDACSAPCAKTVAAVRKQVPVVAGNVVAMLAGRSSDRRYDGYGACPITVERGRVLMPEFGYGGRLLPTFPLDPLLPRRTYWWMKRYVLPAVYWRMLLKGREVLSASHPPPEPEPPIAAPGASARSG
jgi:sulfide:quinone oxidoreductase